MSKEKQIVKTLVRDSRGHVSKAKSCSSLWQGEIRRVDMVRVMACVNTGSSSLGSLNAVRLFPVLTSPPERALPQRPRAAVWRGGLGRNVANNAQAATRSSRHSYTTR